MKKKLLRLCSIVLVISMVLGNVVSLAADDTTSTATTGMTFSPTLKGVIDKPFESSIKTVEATVCLPKELPEGVNNYQGVILGMYGANSVPALCFEINSGGYPNVYYYKEGSGVPTRVLFNKAINTGLVTNLAFVLNDSEEGTVVSCYVNGEEVAVHSTSAQLGRTFEDPTIAYCVGGDYRTDPTGSYFKGEIHSLAVYSEVRTADEIASDVTAGVTTSDEGLMAYYDLTTVDASTTEVNNGATVTQGTYDLELVETWMNTRRPALNEEDIAYSIALVGDTQIATEYDVYYEKNVVAGIYDWLLENKDEKNIEFVIGLGDIVQGESTYSFDTSLAKDQEAQEAEWNYAMEQIHTLDGEIPYSLIRGNHDSQEMYNKYVTQAGHGNVIDGALDDTMLNTWQELVVGDIKYLIMSLDLGASDTELAWAEEVIKTHPNHNVIISTHAYLNDDRTTLDANDSFYPAQYPSATYPDATHNRNNGDEMWDNYFSKYDNIVMIVSGHIGSDDVIMEPAIGDNGNTVAQMLIDPQSLDNTLVKAGDIPTGMICLLNFSADGKNVQVEQYSTANGQWYMSTSQISFEMNVIEDANQRLLLNEELMTVRPSYVSASTGETVYRAFGQHVQNCTVNANQIILTKDNTCAISYTAPSNGMLKITDMTLAFHTRTDAYASGREFEFAVVDEEGKILSNRGNILTINADNKILSGLSIETQKLTKGESIYFVFHSNLGSSNLIDCISTMEFSVDGGSTWTQVNTTHSSYYVPWPNDITTYPLKTGYPEVEQGMGGFYYQYSDVYEVVSYQEPEYVYVEAKEMPDGREARSQKDFPFVSVNANGSFNTNCMTSYNQIIASAGYTNIIAYEAPEKGKIRIDEMQVWTGNYAPQTTDRGFAFAVIDSEGKILSNNGQVYMSNTIYTSESNATSTAENIKVPTQKVEAGDRIYFVFHGNAGSTTCIKCNAKILFCKDGESTWTQVNSGSNAQSMTLYSANNYINSSSTVEPTQGEGNFYYMYSEPNTTDKDGVAIGTETEGIVTIYEAPVENQNYYDKHITAVATDGTVSYVDLDMLNVKIQSKVHKDDDGNDTDKTDVRFIASVDNLSYQKAGFLFTKDATIANDTESFVVGTIPDKANRDTTKVYSMLLANGIYRRASDIYANDGCNTTYAYVFEMTGIPANDGTIYVRAYVLLDDGNYVYGEPRAIDVTAAGTVN